MGAYVQTKQEILDYIRQETKGFQTWHMEGFSASGISRKKNISRSLVSQYLNELVKDGELVKINSRPVYFLHRETLEIQYDVRIQGRVYYSVDELMQELLQARYQMLDFGNAIGCMASLGYCVEQCKAAVSYPLVGLPILLTGEHGTGKSWFAKLTYEYAQNNSLIDANRAFYEIDCSEYSENPDKLRITLFGERHGDGSVTRGLMEAAEGSILFFDEAHNLSSECQEQLFSYLDEGHFHRVGDKENWVVSGTRLIFATMKNPPDVFLRTFLRRIPVIVHLPSLAERSYEEKEELIVRFLKQESARMGQELYISRRAMNVLLHHTYGGNIGELIGAIRTSCASVWLNKGKQDKLAVLLYCLPAHLLAAMKVEKESIGEEDALINISRYERDNSTDRITAMFDELLDAVVEHGERESSFTEFLDLSMKSIWIYYDYLVFEEKYVHVKIRAVQNVLTEIFDAVSEKYAMILPVNCSFVLARSTFLTGQKSQMIEQWEQERSEELQEATELLEREAAQESLIAHEILQAIRDNLDMKPQKINQIFLTLNIAYYNCKLQFRDTTGIIISHGYSTASSIADTANKMLGTPMYYAMDMPLDMQPDEIVFRLKKHITTHGIYRNIVLLVDMGSLEQIGSQLEDIPNINVGIVNNVSTQMALEIGFRLMNRTEMETILKDLCQNMKLSYKMINTQKRSPAILFTSEMGVHSAERIMELFKSSLPGKAGELKMVFCEYPALLREENTFLEKYQVLCVIGTTDPGSLKTPFFSLDMLIAGEESRAMEYLLMPYLSKEEAEKLSENLLKNFSLQNVLQNLTILNADTLLEFVITAVKNLETLLGKKFTNRMLTGFYVHMSCLVERLVTKMPLGELEGQEEFGRTHTDFVMKTRKAFSEIEHHYRIQLPLSEILFLFEFIEKEERIMYIQSDKKE